MTSENEDRSSQQYKIQVMFSKIPKSSQLYIKTSLAYQLIIITRI